MLSGFIDLPWWGYVLVALGMTHITIASVTIYLHRHQAHRALELHPLPSHFFRFWLWLTTGMVTKEWAAIHRKHHAKCETVDDPHSPQVKGIRKVLWEGAELYREEAKNRETLDRYGHGTPNDWLERNVYERNAIGIALMLIIDVVLFGAIGITIWAVQMVWIPFWAAGVVNGLGHYWGYRNYDCTDAATNLVPWGILIGGEELHNNHHSFATSAKLSARWYEFDIGWMYIRILEILGLAKARKVIPTPRFCEARKTPDLEMLQAIITHRYDVMTRYVGSLKQLYREELDKLKGAGIEPRKLRRLVLSSREKLAEAERVQLERALDHSKRLATVVKMRTELAALWARSSASSEQLLSQLQDWIHRAEQSGIAQLQEFSGRLRCYAA
ncbi:DesA family fatty acid desaturase [Cognatazoarcus halotolerans]|uniref:DesA family fatty acid desaturase n=1 Tax=Cognatazoarcus halotolerans TaxID=2686016 RepID=UPI001356A7C7|nr:fatty acid desaturase [Cognatazoarcus halotolerans]MBX3679177.1 fatty acid desaturase [Rhodocyclaceae bacterium]MCB1898987.1 fatty acid desaturase [Rhodocyclaceae bacterium]MCP5311015.1 fatty acid desaturase [Zoogloeaceae bacterium]